MDGKTVLLTGGTEGIGKAAALELAKRRAHLVLVGRNPEKTERVVRELRRASGNVRIDSIIGDLSLLAGMRAVAAAFAGRHDRLDVLVNNAGAMFERRELTADGIERTFALNHLSYFVLTHALLEVLSKTPGARVVNTASRAHRGGRLADLGEAATRPHDYAAFDVYSDSKLANILFTRELARRLHGRDVVVNCFHPGFVRSGFGMNTDGLWRLAISTAASLFGRTPEKGAETLVWLATSPEGGRVSGEYFADKRPAKVSSRAEDDHLARDLWAFSERLAGLA